LAVYIQKSKIINCKSVGKTWSRRREFCWNGIKVQFSYTFH